VARNQKTQSSDLKGCPKTPSGDSMERRKKNLGRTQAQSGTSSFGVYELEARFTVTVR